MEVSTAGETDLHVFDGLVDVVDPGAGTHRIKAGATLRWSDASKSASSGSADFDKFVTASALARKRLQAHHAQMLARDDLLLYYDFAGIEDDRLPNRVPDAGESTHGRISGATRVSGRVEGTGALLFEQPGDEVTLRLERPAEIWQFTMAIWAKLDRVEGGYAALFNSDGWNPGDIHFQVTRDGNLRVGVNGGSAFQSPSWSMQPGRWHLFAVSWNLEAREAKLYCDGRRLPATPVLTGSQPLASVDAQFGACRIGAWGDRPPGNLRETRDFKGRIDEVMIFDHALTDEEMAELHRAGSP